MRGSTKPLNTPFVFRQGLYHPFEKRICRCYRLLGRASARVDRADIVSSTYQISKRNLIAENKKRTAVENQIIMAFVYTKASNH